MKNILIIAAVIGIAVAPFFGYGLNVVKLVQCDFKAPYKTEVVRTVSLIPVIGMITGYLTIGEEADKAE